MMSLHRWTSRTSPAPNGSSGSSSAAADDVSSRRRHRGRGRFRRRPNATANDGDDDADAENQRGQAIIPKAKPIFPLDCKYGEIRVEAVATNDRRNRRRYDDSDDSDEDSGEDEDLTSCIFVPEDHVLATIERSTGSTAATIQNDDNRRDGRDDDDCESQEEQKCEAPDDEGQCSSCRSNTICDRSNNDKDDSDREESRSNDGRTKDSDDLQDEKDEIDSGERRTNDVHEKDGPGDIENGDNENGSQGERDGHDENDHGSHPSPRTGPHHDIEMGARLNGDKEPLPPPPFIDPTLPITPSRIVTLKKQGHRFLGICDVRRAVIIMDFAAMMLSFSILTWYIGHEINVFGRSTDVTGTNGDEYFSRTDQDYADFWKDGIPSYLPVFWITIGQGQYGRMVAYLMTSCTLFYSTLGMIGAYYYINVLVFGAACWPFVHAFVGVAHGDYAALSIALFAVYPHVVLMYELHRKIMTPFHYKAREDYCLCRRPRQRKLPMAEGESRL